MLINIQTLISPSKKFKLSIKQVVNSTSRLTGITTFSKYQIISLYNHHDSIVLKIMQSMIHYPYITLVVSKKESNDMAKIKKTTQGSYFLSPTYY